MNIINNKSDNVSEDDDKFSAVPLRSLLQTVWLSLYRYAMLAYSGNSLKNL